MRASLITRLLDLAALLATLVRGGLVRFVDDHELADAQGAPWGEFYRAGWVVPVEVHQACGVLIARLGLSGEDALARLRGRAALIDQSVVAVADAVIAGRLHFGS